MITDAIHLWAGFQSQSQDDQATSHTVEWVASFVPAIEEASQALDLRLVQGETGWSKVFDYDVTQAAGAWLYYNPRATLQRFRERVQELCE
jgi:hypothetical protein